MEFLLALLGGFVLGALHAFDADHMAAVTAFSSFQPHARKAAGFGIVWGLGHSTTLILFGLLVVAFRFVIPPLLQSAGEAMIGLVLVGIGLWALHNLLRRKNIHVHKHTHDGVEHIHFHSHQTGTHHRHRHSMFLIGAAHGLAGTGSVLVLIPVTLSDSVLSAVVYLLLFALGTVSAMGIFACFLGYISTIAQSRRVLPVLQGAAGVTSIVVGLVWIFGVLSS